MAGNLVLVALAAVGAYLFYFDGGVTQAALASQAVQEVASGEGELVAQAPREEAESRAGRPPPPSPPTPPPPPTRCAPTASCASTAR